MEGIVEQIREEIKSFKEQSKRDILASKQVIAFEQRIFRAMPQQCAKCPRTTNLTLDHIVPRIVLKDFGVDVEHEIIVENYQVLCRPCNMFKSGRLDFSNPKTKQIITLLLERV